MRAVDALAWQDRFEERAAILEFDAGLRRHQAEARAYADVLTRWRLEHPNEPIACFAEVAGEGPPDARSA
ncbi:hypothetical protein M0638_07065 [Roseomonas sp. NAR14]|uniref:Uncharacterized protein n=1 Tax=Roseomonas acroporae TaxID=2937791 RepID=A0A9X1Y6N4_9PROT|nr:hypothetical protein [Roseomonas acroporae]MCK8784135.1 hypothetical protein [Roseomonas acroporae]